MLAGKPYSDYLSKSDQILSGPVHINGDLLINAGLKVKHLKTTNEICGHDLMAIMGDSVLLSEAAESMEISGAKQFTGNVSFGRVIVRGTVFGLGTWDELRGQLQLVQDRINLLDSITFANNFHIKELVVGESINAVPAADFGKIWLITESDQVTYRNSDINIY